MSEGTSASGRTPEIDTSDPRSARIWNYWLGGKDSYPVDRMAGDQVMQMYSEPGDVPGVCGVGRKP